MLKKAASFLRKIHTSLVYYSRVLSSKGRKGNDTANCAKCMKFGIVVFFKVLIQNFKGATILGHVINDVNS